MDGRLRGAVSGVLYQPERGSLLHPPFPIFIYQERPGWMDICRGSQGYSLTASKSVITPPTSSLFSLVESERPKWMDGCQGSWEVL